jgi:hypothetical protein
MKVVNGRAEEVGIAGMFVLPVMEFNAAVWRAEDLGLIEVAADKSGDVRFAGDPEKWEFNEETRLIIEDLPYVLKKFAKSETDFEGNYLSNWTLGFEPQNIFVATKYLINEGIVAEYELTTRVVFEPSKKGLKRGKVPKESKQTYEFYTLPENLDKQWGRKMFPDQSKLID